MPARAARRNLAAMQIDRRTFLATSSAVGAAAALAACGGGGDSGSGASTSTSDSAAESSGGQAQALGPVDQVPVSGGVVYDGPKVVVTQPASGDIRGFSAVCPHQGCLMAGVQDNVIVCPCHNSLFSAEDGALISGPSPTGLPPVSVSVVDGTVYLA